MVLSMSIDKGMAKKLYLPSAASLLASTLVVQISLVTTVVYYLNLIYFYDVIHANVDIKGEHETFNHKNDTPKNLLQICLSPLHP